MAISRMHQTAAGFGRDTGLDVNGGRLHMNSSVMSILMWFGGDEQDTVRLHSRISVRYVTIPYYSCACGIHDCKMGDGTPDRI